MTEYENYLEHRKYEVSHSENPDSPDMFGIVDELMLAKISGYKELQEKIEKGEEVRFSAVLCNDGGKNTKKRERDINRSWKNAEKKNKEWEESLRIKSK